MKRRSGAIEADIGGYPPRLRERVEITRLGHLVDEAALREGAQEVGLEVAHGLDFVDVLDRRLAAAGALV